MMKLVPLFFTALMLSACAQTSTLTPAKTATLITAAEAKTEACPESVLNAGASPADCQCVETELYRLGQIPGALRPTDDINNNIAPTANLDAGASGKRKIAIGLLRVDAFEHCGFFDPSHTVAKNL